MLPDPRPPRSAPQGRSTKLGHSAVVIVTNIKLAVRAPGPEELENRPWTYALDVWPAEDRKGEFHSFNHCQRHMNLGTQYVLGRPVHSLVGWSVRASLSVAVQPHCLKMGLYGAALR